MNALAQGLARQPRVQLAHLPSRLEPLPWLSTELGRPVHIKRDDCTGLGGGGNKLRKLEFLLAEATEQGADTVITVGGPQSNHARLTAAACARLSLHCELLLEPVLPDAAAAYSCSGNVLLDRLFGARLHFLDAAMDRDEQMQQLATRLRAQGRRPYLIDLGGSSPRGTLGYVAAAVEVTEQAQQQGIALDTIILATGSCGTQAGLLLGLRALGLKTRVLGIATSPDPGQLRRRQRVRELFNAAAALLELDLGIDPADIDIEGDFSGPGYGVLTADIKAALHQLASREGLLLDPVYTGKAMSGLLALAERGALGTGPLLFWHTGGTPALFGYPELLDEA